MSLEPRTPCLEGGKYIFTKLLMCPEIPRSDLGVCVEKMLGKGARRVLAAILIGLGSGQHQVQEQAVSSGHTCPQVIFLWESGSSLAPSSITSSWKVA